MLLISMPNSAITVSQMHIPPKTHFQKAVGGVSKFVCGQSSFVLNSSAYMNWVKKHFYLFDIVLFSETNVSRTGLSRIRLSISEAAPILQIVG